MTTILEALEAARVFVSDELERRRCFVPDTFGTDSARSVLAGIEAAIATCKEPLQVPVVARPATAGCLIAPEIAQIRALADAATPGPWECDGIEPYAAHEKNHATGHIVCLFDAEWRKSPENKANAEFVAAARTAVPALCDTVEELRKNLAEAKKEQPRERQMWMNALAIVLANPAELDLIGSEPNAVREALRPVAGLHRKLDDTEIARAGVRRDWERDHQQLADLQRQNAELLADRNRLQDAIHNQLASLIDSESDVERLKKRVADADHGKNCGDWFGDPCNCWKAVTP